MEAGPADAPVLVLLPRKWHKLYRRDISRRHSKLGRSRREADIERFGVCTERVAIDPLRKAHLCRTAAIASQKARATPPSPTSPHLIDKAVLCSKGSTAVGGR